MYKIIITGLHNRNSKKQIGKETMRKEIYSVVLSLLVLASMVSAADYTNEYTTTGIKNAILDIIGGIVSGIAGERSTIGTVIALLIVVGLLLLALGKTLTVISRTKSFGKGA
jgi:hypothetical protein